MTFDPMPTIREQLGMPPAPVAPLPTEPGRYVIKGGTSVNHWASREYIQTPNGDWLRVTYVDTTEDEIRAGLFEGQILEPLIAASDADL